ncbi:hypothetical protein LF1_28830 [Rubripirellula obstinata]|uniref:Uncharacterized protein n=1 Tax=Rubripirellula obstinata TaxID=406547 RepID=A0A5B1CLX1_9BACT|nr:hypothetical protein LF1_28830 [Rubripirellula obstinata]
MITQRLVVVKRLAIVVWMLSILIAAATVRAESNGTIGRGDVANLETADWGWDEA